MAELDYAFLAEFASIQPNGVLNVIGASYTSITVPFLPAEHLLSIAGRVRSEVGEAPNQITVRTRTPRFELSLDVPVLEPRLPRPYGTKVGRLFAVATVIPVPDAGLYEVFLLLDGLQVRRLAFDVELQTGER